MPLIYYTGHRRASARYPRFSGLTADALPLALTHITIKMREARAAQRNASIQQY